MTRRGWLWRRWRRAVGWPGLAGSGLLVLAALFYVLAVLPDRLGLEGVRQQVAAARTRATAPASAGPRGVEARLAAFYNGFPARDSARAWLEKIYAAGNATALNLERGEYKLSVDRNSRLLTYEINLPVRGSYVQIREFVRTVLDGIPTIALRDLQMKRATIGDPGLEAQIRFVLYLREAA